MNTTDEPVWRPTMHLRVSRSHCNNDQLEQLWECGDEEAWHKGEDAETPKQEWRPVEIVWYPNDTTYPREAA